MAEADDPDFDRRLKAVEALTHLFRFERTVYLVITSLSLIMLLASAGVLLSRPGNQNMTVMVGLFGSSGLITYSLGRLLRMWDQALGVLIPKAAPAAAGDK